MRTRPYASIFWVVHFYAVPPTQAASRAGNGLRSDGDCYSAYDGKPLLKLNSSSANLLEAMRTVTRELGCAELGSESSPWLFMACDTMQAARLAGLYGERVAVLSSDTGAQFRQSSGTIRPYMTSDLSSLLPDFYDDWRGYEDRLARLTAVVDASGGAAKLADIGTSVEGRAIQAVRFTGRGYKANMTTRVVLTFQQHAREWIAGMAGLYAVEMIAAKARQEPGWLKGTEIVLVPLSNPDGFIHSTKIDRWWRKNRRVTSGSECKGVDLNRNWDPAWGGVHSTSSHPCSEVFYGAKPFSEPEVKAIKSLIDESQVTIHLDIHSFSELIICPWSYKAEPHPRRAEMDILGQSMKAAMQSATGEQYTYGGNEVIYMASGILPDYATTAGAVGFTVELRPKEFSGGGFAPPPSAIRPAAEECLAGIFAAMEWTKGSPPPPTPPSTAAPAPAPAPTPAPTRPPSLPPLFPRHPPFWFRAVLWASAACILAIMVTALLRMACSSRARRTLATPRVRREVGDRGDHGASELSAHAAAARRA